ncbi:hypothetical protein CBER1_11454 [Cercospora berteroae]|uniref:Uncharacterized protein n=1 Tax=Cercospora berteroae TaxID=357750 RepID=A0A2S6C045_9PEZI|nr:hypothetical protein CBER1_11454 [Cercospora berteroae]
MAPANKHVQDALSYLLGVNRSNTKLAAHIACQRNPSATLEQVRQWAHKLQYSEVPDDRTWSWQLVDCKPDDHMADEDDETLLREAKQGHWPQELVFRLRLLLTLLLKKTRATDQIEKIQAASMVVLDTRPAIREWEFGPNSISLTTLQGWERERAIVAAYVTYLGFDDDIVTGLIEGDLPTKYSDPTSGEHRKTHTKKKQSLSKHRRFKAHECGQDRKIQV